MTTPAGREVTLEVAQYKRRAIGVRNDQTQFKAARGDSGLGSGTSVLGQVPPLQRLDARIGGLAVSPGHARTLLGFLITASFPVLVGVDAGVARIRGWIPIGGEDRLLPASGSLVGLALLSLLIPQVRRFYARRAGAIAVVAVSTLVTLLVAEGLLADRIRVPFGEHLFHLRPPLLERTYNPDSATMPGVTGPSSYCINSVGVRADPVPATESDRILCVGGSTTECLYLDQAETWTSLLQKRLRAGSRGRVVWVGNAGFSGYGTFQHLEFITHSPLVPQMDCLIFLVGLNDLSHFVGGRDSYTSFFHPQMKIKPLLVKSNLANLVRAAWDAWSRRFKTPSVEVEDETGRNYRLRREKRARSGDRVPLPDPGAALDDYADRLRRIVDCCAEKGLRVVFVTQPVLWDKDLSDSERALLWMGETSDGRYVDVVDLREALDRYNAVVQSVARELGITVVDLEGMSGDARFFYDDCHLNEAGAAEAARRIAEAF